MANFSCSGNSFSSSSSSSSANIDPASFYQSNSVSACDQMRAYYCGRDGMPNNNGTSSSSCPATGYFRPYHYIWENKMVDEAIQ